MHDSRGSFVVPVVSGSFTESILPLADAVDTLHAMTDWSLVVACQFCALNAGLDAKTEASDMSSIEVEHVFIIIARIVPAIMQSKEH